MKSFIFSESGIRIYKDFRLSRFSKFNENLPKINRDESWLHWRLMECPYKKDIYFFEHNNSFSIVHIYFVKKIKRMNILFTYGINETNSLRLYKLIVNWALENNIDYIWAVHNNKNFKNFFPNIFNRPLRLATWSSDSSIMKNLQNGFDDLQAIDSDIESCYFVE